MIPILKRMFVVSILSGLTGLSPIYAAIKDTLVYCVPAAPEGFDGALYAGADTHDASSRTIFNRLIYVNPKTGKILPELATHWIISEDGTEYTFSLAKNISFHQSLHFKSALEALNEPQRLFNADDVLFTFNRILDKEHFYQKALPRAYPGLGGTDFESNIKSLEKIDEHTIKFTLKDLNSSFLFNLGLDFVSIQSEQYARGLVAQHQPEKINHYPIGTGPFIFQTYQKDAVIRYIANPDYFKGAPKIKNLIFSITPSSIVRVQKILANECDLISYPPLTSIAELKQDKNLVIDDIPALSLGYMYLNTANFAPLTDPRVRNALSYAIDRNTIVKEIFYGSAIAAGSFVPITSPSHDPSIKPRAFDLDKARALLKEAGYEDGFNMEVWAIPVQRAAQPDGKRLAEILQQDWAKIGIKSTIRTSDWAEYLKTARSGEYKGVTTMGASGTLAPDSFVTWLRCEAVGKANFAQWCNPEFDELLHRAKTAKTEAERLALYQESQRFIDAQAPIIPLAYPTNYVAYHKRVKNFEIRADGALFFDNVVLDDDQ
ncbi:dipeptide/heme ABC transporter periplasmic binding protein [Gammaproteobacteria bacterium]|nr:dipeptide/heme ABC transporter periplasmic binding protein [Gammaproteobacteria bacterium]